jgi:tRNA nucleotidyltransferase (CCA-adding enzyme)
MRVPEAPLVVCRALQAAGHEAYVVGGCVRDVFLGRTPHDWDIATSALPDVSLGLFPHVIPTGLQHGTVTVMVGNEPIEVTTFRTDGTYSDGRHPDSVRLGVTLEQDLARRDFTVNAMAYDPVADRLVDPFGGRKDIDRRLIKAVGAAIDRFSEDGLRTMRAVRFAAVLEFALEPATAVAVPRALAYLTRVAVERVRDELLKLLGARRPSLGLVPAWQLGILALTLPEAPADAWLEVVGQVDGLAAPPLTRLGALLLRAGPDGTDRAAARLKLSIPERRRLGAIARYAGAWGHVPSPAEARRFVQRVGAEYLGDLYPFWPELVVERFASVMGERPALSARDLAVTGQDVMEILGVKAGPVVGRTMAELLEAVTENPALNERDALLALLAARRP